MATAFKAIGLFKGVWGQIEKFFQMMFHLFWRDMQFYGDVIVNAFTKSAEKAAGADKKDFISFMAQGLVEVGILEEDDLLKMQKIFSAFGRWKNIFLLINVLMLQFKAIFIKSDILSSGYHQRLNATFKPALPEIGSVIRAGFIAPEKNTQIRDIAHRFGLKDEDIDLLYIANYATYPFELIRVLSLRGFLNNTETFEAMRELGFTDTRIENILKTWEVLPSPQDLFWMVAKEAFEEDIIQHIGLGDEFPVGQVEFLKKQGISEEWAKRYWYAHWDTPAIGQGFEMLQRGKITFEELDMLFRNAEIPPFWRDKLTQIAYNPIGRIDLRRINKAGVIPDDQLSEYYGYMGYSPDNAAIMAEWTVAYNADEDKTLAKGQIMGAYEKKAISKEDTVVFLKDLKYTGDQIDFMLSMSDYEEQIDIQEEIIADIKDRYILNLNSKAVTEAKLNKLNITGQRISVLLSRWETLIYKNRKLPSKTDLDKFFKAGIINTDGYLMELDRLGYSFRLANMYVELSKKQKKGK